MEQWESLEAVIEPIAQRPELRDVVLYLEGRAALAKKRVGTARAKFEASIQALPKEAELLRRSLFFFIAGSAFKNSVVMKKPLLPFLTPSTLASVPKRVKKPSSQAAPLFVQIAQVMPYRSSRSLP
jgi:hypothetical protein